MLRFQLTKIFLEKIAGGGAWRGKSTLLNIVAGLKLGVGISLLLVVTSEMIAADKGIGFLILSSADFMQTTRLLFGIMVLLGMGVSFAWILEKLEWLLLPWRE